MVQYTANRPRAKCHPHCKEVAKGLCKTCYRLDRAWPSEKKEHIPKKLRVRRWSLKRNYGLTLQRYDEMLEDQGGVCKICRSTTPGGHGSYFQVDHCHSTGRVRGLLCQPCNTSLGNFKDSVELLEAAIRYLKG